MLENLIEHVEEAAEMKIRHPSGCVRQLQWRWVEDRLSE